MPATINDTSRLVALPTPRNERHHRHSKSEEQRPGATVKHRHGSVVTKNSNAAEQPLNNDGRQDRDGEPTKS
jgi:hypothetical protein